MAASPENDRLSGHVDEDEQSAAQQKTDSAKNEKNGNAQPEVSMVSTGDDFIMVDLVIFLFG